jgi:hypothetical protein
MDAERRDDPAAGRTAYVTAIFVAVIVITVIALTAYFGRVTSEETEAKVVRPESAALATVRAEQQARLAAYRIVSADSGFVAVPIERAMELVADELARSASGAAPASPPDAGK